MRAHARDGVDTTTTKEIIAKLENGVRVSDLAAQYNMAKSTSSSFLKNKEAIKAADVAKGVKIVHSKQRLICLKNTPRFQIIYNCIDVSRRSSKPLKSTFNYFLWEILFHFPMNQLSTRFLERITFDI